MWRDINEGVVPNACGAPFQMARRYSLEVQSRSIPSYDDTGLILRTSINVERHVVVGQSALRAGAPLDELRTKMVRDLAGYIYRDVYSAINDIRTAVIAGDGDTVLQILNDLERDIGQDAAVAAYVESRKRHVDAA